MRCQKSGVREPVAGGAGAALGTMTQRSPFRYFKTSPEIIRLAIMLYVRFPLSPRNVTGCTSEASRSATSPLLVV